jgi:hypothetical protein
MDKKFKDISEKYIFFFDAMMINARQNLKDWIVRYNLL